MKSSKEEEETVINLANEQMIKGTERNTGGCDGSYRCSQNGI
ncbi:MAG: hypothetical protein QXQ46_06040 [Thermoplasmatales archaeon]